MSLLCKPLPLLVILLFLTPSPPAQSRQRPLENKLSKLLSYLRHYRSRHAAKGDRRRWRKKRLRKKGRPHRGRALNRNLLGKPGPVKLAAPPLTVFIFLDQLKVDSKGGQGDVDLRQVIRRIAQNKLNALEEVRLKTYKTMPDVSKLMAGYGDFAKLDRVQLIAIKNKTGFDGLVHGNYKFTKRKLALTLSYVDFRNGQIFRKRKFNRPLDAELLNTIQNDLVEFATKIRRTYRVTVHVDSQPSGAVVRINGRYAGKTPLVKELKGGHYRIEVRKKGYKSYRKNLFLKDGDMIRISAVLYNPLASRFLNAAPGFRVDSRQFVLGYRYTFLGIDRPKMRDLHTMNVSFLMRIRAFSVGLRVGFGLGMDTETLLDTFAGPGRGIRTYDMSLYQFMAVLKYAIWEKYSFFSIYGGLALGMTHVASNDNKKWSFSAEAFAEFTSRLARSKNFSLEVALQLGVSYLGEMAFVEKTFSLFGDGPESRRVKPLIGFTAGVSLRFVFWNGIF